MPSALFVCWRRRDPACSGAILIEVVQTAPPGGADERREFKRCLFVPLNGWLSSVSLRIMSVMSHGTIPMGQFLDNDSPHNFSKLAREFLDAAKFTHAGFKGVPMWPTHFLLFQSLENLLKAYLLAHGATMHHIQFKIGHKLCDALVEAKAKGLAVDAPKDVEDAVMAMSRDYTARDFQYRSIGQWTQVFPNYLIAYVEAVSKVVNY